MLTSNRSDSRPYTRSASVTISNRRVRTRTHGGVAGVGGQPPPLCRSSQLFIEVIRPTLPSVNLIEAFAVLSYGYAPS
jgi:hypothetical protein